jgi:hypothetical protein
MADLGRVLVGVGIAVALLGVALLLLPRVPWLGRLPGDFVVRRGPVTAYVPLMTGLVVSVVVTVLLNLFWRR